MATLDTHAKNVLDAMAASGQPPLDQFAPPEARQGIKAGFAALQAPPVEVASVKNLSAGSIPVRLFRPAGSSATAKLPAIMYFHGGGWVLSDLDVYDGLCRRLSNASGCVVVSVDYRLAPEHKFPAAVDDCYFATVWVHQHAAELGIDGTRLGVSGDSAGGNLAAVVCLLARDKDGPKLSYQGLIYPVTDASGEQVGKSPLRNDYFLTGALMRYFYDHYLPSPVDAGDFRASPLKAKSLAGLPPATVLVAGFDPLSHEGEAYANALKAAGVPTKFVSYGGQIHGFMSMDGAIPDAIKAIEEMGKALGQGLK